MSQWKMLLPDVVALARKAGEAILEVYDQKDMDVEYKSDNSPVTQADLGAHDIISQGLSRLTPGMMIVSEEDTHIQEARRQQTHINWLVDPLDGTKEFIAKTGEFTVNIALVENGHPVLGVLYVPVQDEVYFADAIDKKAYWQKGQQPPEEIQIQPHKQGPCRLTMSRRHHPKRIQSMLEQFVEYEIISCGSALKFGLLATGVADIYPRLGPTSEWDTAAGHCLLKATGGQVVNLEGQELTYNKPDSLLNPPFLAIGPAFPLDKFSLQDLQKVMQAQLQR